jgi:phosphoenolpyruvate-protein kinase (PTS system EI component)
VIAVRAQAIGASPGIGIGPARRLGATERLRAASGPADAEQVRAALAAVAEELGASAQRLRTDGRAEEAEMVEASATIAADPELAATAERAVGDDRRSASDAILFAAETHAALLAALDDPYLAGRADDVRSVGRRAAMLAAGDTEHRPQAGEVLLARDLGPADVAELDEGVAAIALAGGGATTHAVIVARSLGIPMVVCAGDELLAIQDGARVIVDGDRGDVIVDPGAVAAADAAARMAARRASHGRDLADAALPTETLDGHHVSVRVNAAAAPEIRTALEVGADGVGLLRTELTFLEAADWPTEAEHRAALRPVFELLAGAVTTVRLLDFGGDKTPPFLAGGESRGIALLLEHPAALAAQLRAIASTRGAADLRILLPMAEHPGQLEAVRDAFAQADAGRPAAFGAMIETPAAVGHAPELAAHSDFLSIGTNDLAHGALGEDRFGGGRAELFDPRVLALVRDAVAAAHAAGIPVEVCGEAASHRVAMPLLVGLGVDELSVGASRVPTVRRWVRALDRSLAAAIAERALACGTAEAVVALVSDELGDTLGKEAEAG